MLTLKFLHVAGNISTAAGYWGDYNCDVPLHTLINLMQHLASVKDQVNLLSCIMIMCTLIYHQDLSLVLVHNTGILFSSLIGFT